ncbi:uncharacterized protein C3orf85 homolog isoform X1 [Harpia harpyja]|uniref:uncharacterized protein C3orf85 homolog isoform X1 n=1 Tax=Harpia harpyja TaxID=202280 RepID=UPI0022B0D102|nr:uncharacterized protein C3orf85 homolog isoform X1 [Harpia harpyja]
MSLNMFQILVYALLFTGVLGAPFLTEESANQFIRLKRQIPYSQNYWDTSSSQYAWGYIGAEQQQHQILHGYATAVWDSPPATDKDKLLNPTHLISGHIRIWHVMYLPLCI